MYPNLGAAPLMIAFVHVQEQLMVSSYEYADDFSGGQTHASFLHFRDAAHRAAFRDAYDVFFLCFSDEVDFSSGLQLS